MEFSARPCELSEVIGVYRDVFINEKGWPAEDLISRLDGRNFILLADGELAGGMKIIIKKEAQAPLMFEQEFYEIPEDSGEIAIVAIRKKYRGLSALKYLFKAFYQFALQEEELRYFAVVDPAVNTVFSIFGFEMGAEGKIVWGEMCYPGALDLIRAREKVSKISPNLYEFLANPD